MRIAACILIGLVMSVQGFSQELTADEKASLEKMDRDFASDPATASFQYVWLAYRSGDAANYAKADAALNAVISKQDGDSESLTYGQWNWTEENGERRADLNNALFRAEMVFTKLWDHQSKMSPETKENFLTCCKRITEAAKRRWDTEVFDIGRDFSCYSNIFVLYVETLTLAGDRFNEARLTKMAKSQWTRWYNHISAFGIDEFASPTYNWVVFSHLWNIHNFCHDERIEGETKEVMDQIYTLQSAITHPLLRLPVCGISRDYRNFLIQGDARSEVLTTPIEGYTPPEPAIAMNANRKYPFEVEGKASIMPFIFRSYQREDAAMGSMTGGNCFQQQMHCVAAVGKNENDRAVLFVQGSYTPVNGYTDQQGLSILCVYNHLPTYWHTTQWRGDMAHYRETFGEFGIGITPNWREKTHSPEHIVLEAYGYEAHIFPFVIKDGKAVSCDLPLKHRTTTSLRYHPRPRTYDEYVFPEDADWFGAVITLVKSGEEAPEPKTTCDNKDGVLSFTTAQGQRVRVVVTGKGETKPLFNVDPSLAPLFKIVN